MSHAYSPQKPRRTIANISIVGLSQLHLRNPYVVALWSALFPGAGHFMLARYLRGYLLFAWEFIINFASNVNLALFYTILGNFEKAKAVIDSRWALLYVPVYLFAVWDSYRSAVDINKFYILAEHEDAPVQSLDIKPLGLNYLCKYAPFVPPTWCLLTPGLGQLMLHRFVSGSFIITIWIIVIYFSKVLPAINLTMLGQFAAATRVLDIHWFLNIPSIYFFSAYLTYQATIEQNKLFEWEQARYLKNTYQSKEFPFPESVDEKSSVMYVISVFEPALSVELAVTALEKSGISRRHIMAAPIEKQKKSSRFFDTIHDANRTSQFDLPMVLGAFLALFGCIYGFVLSWGPVVWGVIGGIIGFGAGLLFKYLRFKKSNKTELETEVVLFVTCEENRAEAVKKVLSDNGALGIQTICGASGCNGA